MGLTNANLQPWATCVKIGQPNFDDIIASSISVPAPYVEVWHSELVHWLRVGPLYYVYERLSHGIPRSISCSLCPVE